MAARRTPSKGTLKYPVFVFPASLNFYMDDPASLKKVVTLYNPYDIGITFKVYANQPSKYKVVDPVGSIKAKCCIDIVVRHVSPSVQSVNVTDKFRVDIVEFGHREVIGRTYIPSTLLAGRPPSEETEEPDQEREGFHSVVQERKVTGVPEHTPALPADRGGYQVGEVSQRTYLCLVGTLVCLAALSLPTADHPTPADWSVPAQLHLTLQAKLLIAYALGLLTVTLFRPN